MIYLTTTGGPVILILETANIEEIKAGRPLKTPDGRVVVTWTPDPSWLAGRLAGTGGAGVEVGRLIEESQARPEAPLRPHHPPVIHRFRGDPPPPPGDPP